MRKKNTKDGTPLSSKDVAQVGLDGVKPKKLIDITNMQKAATNDSQNESTFKVPAAPVSRQVITFDDLSTDDATDDEDKQLRKSKVFPRWSQKAFRKNVMKMQSYMNLEGESGRRI